MRWGSDNNFRNIIVSVSVNFQCTRKINLITYIDCENTYVIDSITVAKFTTTRPKSIIFSLKEYNHNHISYNFIHSKALLVIGVIGLQLLPVSLVSIKN